MQCQATTKLGTPCSRKALAGQIYCTQHSKILQNPEQKLELKNEKLIKSELESVDENLYPDLENLIYEYIPLKEYLELTKINPKIYTMDKFRELQKKIEKN